MWMLIFALSLSASAGNLRLSSQMWLSLSSELNLELTTTEKVIKTFSGISLISSNNSEDIAISFDPFKDCLEMESAKCNHIFTRDGYITISTIHKVDANFLDQDLKWSYIQASVPSTHSKPRHLAETVYKNKALITLSSDLKLGWVISGSFITFTLYVDKDFDTEDKYAGFGLKSYSSSADMVDADIIAFYLGLNDVCSDMWSESNTGAEVDDSQDLTCTNKTSNSSYYIYSVSRKLDTGDDQDFSLESIENIRIIWAWGDIVNGVAQQHSSSSSGSVKVILSDNEDPTSESSSYSLRGLQTFSIAIALSTLL